MNKLPLMHSLSGTWHGCISVMCLPAQNSREVFSIRTLGVGESRWIYLAALGEQTGNFFLLSRQELILMYNYSLPLDVSQRWPMQRGAGWGRRREKERAMARGSMDLRHS